VISSNLKVFRAMTVKTTDNDSKQQAYERPELRDLGSVTELTKGAQAAPSGDVTFPVSIGSQ
jgi:hypothetical protein